MALVSLTLSTLGLNHVANGHHVKLVLNYCKLDVNPNVRKTNNKVAIFRYEWPFT
jgi:hypothetical protein